MKKQKLVSYIQKALNIIWIYYYKGQKQLFGPLTPEEILKEIEVQKKDVREMKIVTGEKIENVNPFSSKFKKTVIEWGTIEIITRKKKKK